MTEIQHHKLCFHTDSQQILFDGVRHTAHNCVYNKPQRLRARAYLTEGRFRNKKPKNRKAQVFERCG